MREIRSIEITDEAQVGAARRRVHEYAGGLGFGETELAELDIVVQEIGTNAARYAGGGGVLHYTETLGADAGLELFYWDQGPGIYNLDRAIRDGVSTSGSLGAGLGAIQRLTDEFDVYSTVRTTGRLTAAQARRTSHGTVLLARKWVRREEGSPPALELTRRVGVWSRPHPTEEVNGDAYFIQTRQQRTLYAVVDGLGHGPGAKEAADVALDSLAEWMGEGLEEVLLAAHDVLRATRGAVMGVAMIDRAAERVHYAGVGNIAVRAFETPVRFNPIPANGTLGARLGKIRVWSERWAEGATLLLASDGLSEAWDINSYPGILRRSPQLMAGVMMRDYGRQADDATILVAR
ncbi:MAG: ATP-binding protein [Acidobacteria bacterium]|nr:ATP-binding protein [Acidobacteriota bacterium]